MKIIGEFKKFITRGNIVDMAVGVIVGSSFTAIVNGLSNFILKPLINALLYLIIPGGSTDKIHTVIIPAYQLDDAGAKVVDELGNFVLDMTKTIYIDWGSFINAVINFFLVAVVLFTIVKIINAVRDGQKKAIEGLVSEFATKEERKEMKALGLNFRDKEVLDRFRKEKEEVRLAEEEKAKAEAEEKARQDRLENPTTEDLLKDIRDILRREGK